MSASALDAPAIDAPSKAPRTLGDRRLVARSGLALILANGRYWTSVAPTVHRELKRWRLRAGAIVDPKLRALALSKLDGEGFHAEAAAMLATAAPRAHRSSVVEAIVALELLFDYLDGLTELTSGDPMRDGARLFAALVNAVGVAPDGTGELVEQPLCNDGGYLDELSHAVSLAVARLPAVLAVRQVAERVASRSGEAQTRMHAAAQIGVAQVEEWGVRESRGTCLDWREFVAGAASSVLVLHALIAAAADPRTMTREATQIEEAYLSMCVVLTLVDGLVDHDHDKAHDGVERPGYLSPFADRNELSEVLGQATRRAATQARGLPNSAHHMMLLTGVVAYYGSEPGADGELARPAITRLRRELAPLMAPTLAVMRAWRGARRRARSRRANGTREPHDETSVEEGTVESRGCCR
jgi:tetraprenyl-beta-curcumene synthase